MAVVRSVSARPPGPSEPRRFVHLRVDHEQARVSVVVSSRSQLEAEGPLCELALLGAFRRGHDSDDERAATRFADALERALCAPDDGPIAEITARLGLTNAALVMRARRIARLGELETSRRR